MVVGLQEKLSDKEYQLQRCQTENYEAMSKLQKKLESTNAKYKSKKEAFSALQNELMNETVPLEEFNRVQDTCSK